VLDKPTSALANGTNQCTLASRRLRHLHAKHGWVEVSKYRVEWRVRSCVEDDNPTLPNLVQPILGPEADAVWIRPEDVGLGGIVANGAEIPSLLMSGPPAKFLALGDAVVSPQMVEIFEEWPLTGIWAGGNVIGVSGRMLCRLRHVRRLHLGGFRVTTADLVAVMAGLSLTHLSLEDIGAIDDAVIRLCAASDQLRFLEVTSMRAAWVDVLGCSSSIERMSFEPDTHWTEETVRSLVSNPRLQRLYVTARNHVLSQVLEAPDSGWVRLNELTLARVAKP
jgi:hypothetical protein